MNKKLIVQVSEGLGNQLFMLFNAISLSEQYNKNLIVEMIHLSHTFHNMQDVHLTQC